MPGRSSISRDVVKARIGAALSLAIANSPAAALQGLDDIEELASNDDEIAARYAQARAIASIKLRSVVAGFVAFDAAVAAARRHGEPLMLAKILNNYSSAAIQDGSTANALAYANEALQLFRNVGASISIGLVTLAEALYAAGNLDDAADVLREFHSVQRSDSSTQEAVTQDQMLEVAAIGIPVGLLVSDSSLVRSSRSGTLVDLAFSRNVDWLLGPLAEAFCALHEFEGNREAHDILLRRAASAMRSVDHSLPFAVRVARAGPAEFIARFATLVTHHCAPLSSIMQGHANLWKSFASMRRQLLELSNEQCLHAAELFAEAERPLMRAAALEAGGNGAGALALRRECGARVDAMQSRWRGDRVKPMLGTALTPREAEVASLVCEDRTNKDIAELLGLSERTVHRHCEAIFSKLGVRSRWQLSTVLGNLRMP
jgi:DNA-binding CsgD family transcriptional regulator